MALVQAGRQFVDQLTAQRRVVPLGLIALGIALCLVLIALTLPASAWAMVEGPGTVDEPESDPVETIAPPQIELSTLEMPVGPINSGAIPDDPEEPWAIGFVFYDGVPVAGASATLESRHGSLAVTTQPGPLSLYPYFTATLSAAPLEADLGDLIELEVSYGGETNFSTFMVMSGTQEVYGWLSSVCGPTEVPGSVISSDTIWTPECGPYHVTGNVQILSSVALTLTPGTSLLLDADRAIRADGTLWAEGATNAMITFLPYDGAENWGYILLSGDSSHIWAARMEQGGGADVSDNATIRVDDAPASLAYVTVRHSEADGVRAYNDAVVSLNFLDVSDSAGWGLYVDTDFSSLSIVGNEVRRNAEGGIRVLGGPQGQVASNLAEDNGDSGIWIQGGYTYVLVSYNTCRGNEAAKGGGIRWNDADGALLHNVVRGNSVSGGYAYGGGIFINTYQTLNVQHNIILDNVAGDRGGGVYLTSSEIQFDQNVIDGNAAPKGGGVYVNGAKPDSYLRVNAILRNQASGEGGAVYLDDNDASTHNNTILWNTAGADQGALHLADAPYIGFNNVYGNAPYDVVNADVDDADATLCWWNTTDGGEIDDRIWDLLDDSSVGWVNYAPILEQNNPIAPMAPPTGLVASTGGISVTLHWNPTEDTPFDGYLVYYEPVANGYPYTGTGATEGDSPIFVGDVTSYTLTNLPGGTYYLAVTARDQDADGENDQTEGHESWFSDPATAEILGPPGADFDAVPTSGAAPLTVDFSNTSSGYYQTSLWDLGDGVTSTLDSPTHTYTTVGVFDVSLTVSGSLGSDSLVRPALIHTYEAASAGFAATPTEGPAPLTVDFTNTSAGDYDTCAWTFGDGASSSDCNDPSHTYDAAGDYTVSLTVSGPSGSDTETKVGYIAVREGPTADFTATPTEGTVPLEVTFQNESTGEFDECRWDFGDRRTSDNCVGVVHTYYVTGTFHVSLVVSGDGGRDSQVRNDYVTSEPAAESWTSGGPFGGFVHDLALAPGDPNILYAATQDGVFGSANGGATWAKTNHPAVEVHTVAVSPDDANLVWAGTDDGVYASQDSGEIWLHTGLADAHVTSLAVDPRDGEVVYAGTTDGIYKTEDGGTTWDRKESFAEVYQIIVDSNDSNYVYASRSGLEGSADEGLLRSTDAGATWTYVHVAPDAQNSEEVMALAMTPAGAAQPTIYAFSESLYYDVYKSTDRGLIWTATNNPVDWRNYPIAALTVDPEDPDVVYFGIDDTVDQFYRTTNGGDTWQIKQNGLPNGSPTSIVVQPGTRQVLVGLDTGGLYRSGDMADSWQMATVGLNATQVNDLAVDPTDASRALAAIDGRGHHLAMTNDAGHTWQPLLTTPPELDSDTPAEMGAVALHPQDADTLYAADDFDWTEKLRFYKSTDGGATWDSETLVDAGIWGEDLGVIDIWVDPEDATQSNTLLLAVEGWGSDGGGLYRSTNGGDSWDRKLSHWFTTITADPNDSAVIYAGTEHWGYVYRSTNRGYSWTDLSPESEWVWEVYDLAVAGNGDVYAATSSGLKRWDGTTWASVPGQPPGSIYALRFDHATTPETLLTGGGGGVWMSRDEGSTWSPVNEGLPTLYISSLAVGQPPAQVLYAGPADNGVWTRELLAAEPPAAGFSGAPLAGPIPLTVDFTNTSTGDYNTCAWTFGDGGSSGDCNNPEHIYDAIGVYDVSLSVSGLSGSDTLTRSHYITVYPEGKYLRYLPLLLKHSTQ